jgi:hypothetical protein
MNEDRFLDVPSSEVIDEMWSQISTRVRPVRRRRRRTTAIALVVGFVLAGSGAAAFAATDHTSRAANNPSTRHSALIEPTKLASSSEIDAQDPGSKFQSYANSIGALGVWITAGNELHVRIPAGTTFSGAQIQKLRSFGLRFDLYSSSHTTGDLAKLDAIFSEIYARHDHSSFGFMYEPVTDVLAFNTSYSDAKLQALASELPDGVVISDSGTVDWEVAPGRLPGAAHFTKIRALRSQRNLCKHQGDIDTIEMGAGQPNA